MWFQGMTGREKKTEPEQNKLIFVPFGVAEWPHQLHLSQSKSVAHLEKSYTK